MKRLVPGILVLVLAAVAATPAHAGVAFGVKGGISVSQVQADLFDTNNRTGFVGGVYGAFDLTPVIGIQPELLFVRKGARLLSTDVTIGGIHLGAEKLTLDVDYVEVPVLLRFAVPTAGPVGLRLLAGPVASIKANEQLSAGGLIDYSYSSNEIKSADFGIAAGAAVAIHTGNLAVVGEGRYTFGLTNVSDLPFGGDIKNGSIYAMAGLEFGFGGR
jgi:hypothetical protein